MASLLAVLIHADCIWFEICSVLSSSFSHACSTTKIAKFQFSDFFFSRVMDPSSTLDDASGSANHPEAHEFTNDIPLLLRRFPSLRDWPGCVVLLSLNKSSSKFHATRGYFRHPLCRVIQCALDDPCTEHPATGPLSLPRAVLVVVEMDDPVPSTLPPIVWNHLLFWNKKCQSGDWESPLSIVAPRHALPGEALNESKDCFPGPFVLLRRLSGDSLSASSLLWSDAAPSDFLVMTSTDTSYDPLSLVLHDGAHCVFSLRGLCAATPTILTPIALGGRRLVADDNVRTRHFLQGGVVVRAMRRVLEEAAVFGPSGTSPSLLARAVLTPTADGDDACHIPLAHGPFSSNEATVETANKADEQTAALPRTAGDVSTAVAVATSAGNALGDSKDDWRQRFGEPQLFVGVSKAGTAVFELEVGLLRLLFRGAAWVQWSAPSHNDSAAPAMSGVQSPPCFPAVGLLCDDPALASAITARLTSLGDVLQSILSGNDITQSHEAQVATALRHAFCSPPTALESSALVAAAGPSPSAAVTAPIGDLCLARLLRSRLTVGTAGAASLGVVLPPEAVLRNAFERPHAGQRLSVGARALAKHCHRDASAWWMSCSSSGQQRTLSGSEADKNRYATAVLERLLREANWSNCHMLPHGLAALEIRVPQGYGARWTQSIPPTPIRNAKGTVLFRGFLEPADPDGHAKGWRHDG